MQKTKKKSSKSNSAARGELVTPKELARRTGMSEASIRGKIATGMWRDGEHYFRRQRRLMMDVEACAKFWTEERR